MTIQTLAWAMDQPNDDLPADELLRALRLAHIKPEERDAHLDLLWRHACWEFLDACFAGASRKTIGSLAERMGDARQRMVSP